MFCKRLLPRSKRNASWAFNPGNLSDIVLRIIDGYARCYGGGGGGGGGDDGSIFKSRAVCEVVGGRYGSGATAGGR